MVASRQFCFTQTETMMWHFFSSILCSLAVGENQAWAYGWMKIPVGFGDWTGNNSKKFPEGLDGHYMSISHNIYIWGMLIDAGNS